MLVTKSLDGQEHSDAGSVLPQANLGKLNEKKYIVNAVWWRQWCDYVNFKRADSALDISRCSAMTGRRTSEEVVTFYEKPKKIFNLKLLDSYGRLLPNLVEHYDFVVVEQQIWKHLSRWYDFDQQICRRLIPDSGSQLKLDLYPDELIKKQIK